MRIREQTLWDVDQEFAGYGYGRPEYPPGLVRGITLPEPVAGRRPTIDCCSFVEAVVVGAFQREHGDGALLSLASHRLWMIHDVERHRFGPVDVAIADGYADPVMLCDVPHTPCVFQGWTKRGKGAKGHTILIMDYDSETDRCLTREAAGSLRGVGSRGVRKGQDWRFHGITWEDLIALWPDYRAALIRTT